MTRKDYIRIADAIESVPENVSRLELFEAIVAELKKESDFDENKLHKLHKHIAKHLA